MAGSLVASYEMRERSQFDRFTLFADTSPSWLDAAGANGVAYLETGDRIWPSAWHHMFWNRSITSVVRLQTAESPGVVPQRVVRLRADGTLVDSDGQTVDAAQVVAPSNVLLVGEQVAAMAPSTEPGMTLWNIESPVRVLQRVRGLQPNGDLYGGSSARIEVFGCGAGELQLTLLGKQGAPTRIRLDGETLAERAVPPEAVWRPAVPAPPSADGSGRCVYELESDGLVGSTRIEFVRTG